MEQGPRIYNLFPLLAGPISAWHAHLPRIAEMRFNWIFLNPFHYPGFSGSLYAVKDYDRLHPLIQGDSPKNQDVLLNEFVQAARSHGIDVMMDLVINHTARDSLLVEKHPEWFAREQDGSIRSPRAFDPDHPDDLSKCTIWGDLAEIDYEHPGDPKGLLDYWKEVVRHYAGLGFRGFRCDAAYKVPGAVWFEIITSARALNPDVVFFAETLGCQPGEVVQLHSAGFDYLFNSAKWWDFQADWLLQQYQTHRRIAPSIAFPESHDTPRLAEECGGDERISRMRYLFSAFFSAGVMMPMGYEFGFRQKLDVVNTRPENSESPSFDISSFIRAVNEMKSVVKALNEEGEQTRFTPASAMVVGLLREGSDGGKVVALINRDSHLDHEILVRFVSEAVQMPAHQMREITPQAVPANLDGETVLLTPLGMRVFLGYGPS